MPQVFSMCGFYLYQPYAGFMRVVSAVRFYVHMPTVSGNHGFLEVTH